jgi:hypothetical protein
LFIFNEQEYKFDIYLDNSGNAQGDARKRFYINPQSILNLSISDELHDWAAEGSMTFLFRHTLEEVDMGVGGQQARDVTEFVFRNDGFDLLRIFAVPNTKNTDTPGSLNVDPSDPKWQLSYLFAISRIEDVSEVITEIPEGVTALRLEFKDIRYRLLANANIHYSSAESQYGRPDETRENYPVIPTGAAIQEIYNKVVSNEEYGGNIEFYEISQWDPGRSEIFYTSPAGYSALDDIEYLHSHHVSSASLKGVEGDLGDVALLHTNKPSNSEHLEPICLTPLQEFFKKAGNSLESPGELQLEHFFTTKKSTYEKLTNDFKAPITSALVDDRDFKSAKYGQIVSYSIADMYGEINSEMMVTHPIHSVDVGTRTFKVRYKNNDVITARKAIVETYISQLYKKGDGDGLYIPRIHQTKKSHCVFPSFTLNGDSEPLIYRKGILQLIELGVFQNTCIVFNTLGLSMRASGTFIGIDSIDGSVGSERANVLYGQWFVVKVDHIFEAGKYLNNIYAIKLHKFRPGKQMDVTI